MTVCFVSKLARKMDDERVNCNFPERRRGGGGERGGGLGLYVKRAINDG